MAKAYSVQVGYRAVDRAMQTHGAMGFTNEVGLHHAWHSLRIVNVADGTNEILNRAHRAAPAQGRRRAVERRVICGLAGPVIRGSAHERSSTAASLRGER